MFFLLAFIAVSVWLALKHNWWVGNTGHLDIFCVQDVTETVLIVIYTRSRIILCVYGSEIYA